MKVLVNLRGPLKKFGKSSVCFEWETTEEKCLVTDLIYELGVPVSAISFVAINGSKEGLSYMLTGGEKVIIYPQISGG